LGAKRSGGRPAGAAGAPAGRPSRPRCGPGDGNVSNHPAPRAVPHLGPISNVITPVFPQGGDLANGQWQIANGNEPAPFPLPLISSWPFSRPPRRCGRGDFFFSPQVSMPPFSQTLEQGKGLLLEQWGGCPLGCGPGGKTSWPILAGGAGWPAGPWPVAQSARQLPGPTCRPQVAAKPKLGRRACLQGPWLRREGGWGWCGALHAPVSGTTAAKGGYGR